MTRNWRTVEKLPVEEVFDAVHNPAKLSRYFTTGGEIVFDD